MKPSKNIEIHNKLVPLYRDMYLMTEPECASSCLRGHSCCDAMYCEQTKEVALRFYGIELEETGHPKLPFMGESGCTVAPHLRPHCTVHTCDIGSMGYKTVKVNGYGVDPDVKWTEKYFALRNQIEEIECEIELSDDCSDE